MSEIYIDVSHDEADRLAAVASEMSWFNIMIGDAIIAVSFEQLEALHNAIRPFFVEEPDQ